MSDYLQNNWKSVEQIFMKSSVNVVKWEKHWRGEPSIVWLVCGSQPCAGMSRSVCSVHSALWMLDTGTSPADITGRVRHQTYGTGHQPGRGHDLWTHDITKRGREDCCRKDEASWPLPPAFRTPSQNSWNTPAIVDIRKKDTGRRMHQRAAQMCGEPRWLETGSVDDWGACLRLT